MHRSRFLMSACAAAVAATLPEGVAFAQDTAGEQAAAEPPFASAEEDESAIVITGIRRSLAEAAEIKREASGVVDAITAEDIGKFPDTNLAESLQRIAGVSIDRSNNEGNQVTVRGFGPSFNLVLLNGRQMPNSSSLQSAGVSRSFNFRELGAEQISAVEVYKTGQADVPSGGIGATINIKTPRPFDNPGFVAVVSAKGVYDTSTEVGDKVTPELSGLVSATFLDGALGILVNAQHSERNSRKERVGTQGWVRNRGNPANIDRSAIDTSRNPTEAWWAPWTVDVDVWDTRRVRDNVQAVLQAQPFESLTVTADYTMSRFKETTRMNRQAYWFDTPVGTTDENGTMIEVATFNDELDFWAWDFYQKTENDSFGLNLEWDATDNLKFFVDAHDSTSHSNPNGETAETLANLRNPGKMVDIFATFGGEIPSVGFDDSRLPAGGAFDPANIVSDLYQKRGYEMKNNIRQAQVGARWENEGPLSAINFGASYTDYQIDTFLSATFAFVNVPLDNLGLTFQPLGSTADQFDGQENLFPFIPRYRASDFIGIVQGEDAFFTNPPTIRGVGEETIAAYMSVDFDTEFNGMPVRANAGVRYEQTDVDAYSVQRGIIALNYRHVQELQVIFNDTPEEQSMSASYSRFLPNVDLRIEPLEDVVLRASYSKTIARSSLSAMFPAVTFQNSRPGGPFRASRGNPGLLPYESDNLDVSAEWYYRPGSYASVGLFKKWVDNFIGATVINGPILDVNGDPLRDPSANPRPGCPDASATPNPACLSQPGDPVVTWEIATTGNLRSAKVHGVEATIQHLFGSSGFGFILNGTLVDGDLDLDVFDFSQVLALTGLSNSANVVAFYDKDGLQARIAYNWRDKFLLSLGNEPTFTEAYGQVDVSASYDINDHFTVFVEGLNITNETTRRHGRFTEQLIDAEQYGPRYAVGVRAKF